MHSSHDSYRSSSTASNSTRTPHYQSPSNYLDLNAATGGSERAEFHDRYQNRVNRKKWKFVSKKKTILSVIFKYAWLEKNHVNEVGSQYKTLGKKVDHKPSTWRCEDQAEAGK